MKIIEPKVELLLQDDPIVHVARCARVCYGKETGDDKKTVEWLIAHKHLSMFRHESVYAIIPNHNRELHDNINFYVNCPYVNIQIFDYNTYISTNKQFIMDNELSQFVQLIKENTVTEEEFRNTEMGFNMMRYSFRVITQISTSRELNRVSPNNISERSTRYVYEDGNICRPHWLEGYNISQTLHGKYLVYKDGKEDDDINHKILTYIKQCDSAFNTYKYLVEAGLSRQDARGILPLDTATCCVYTYSIKEWRNIIDLRYYGTTGKPHTNSKIIAGMIRDKLIELGYDFR